MIQIIIGLDIGYGYTKWTTDGKTVESIPSVVTTTNVRDFDSELFSNTSGYRDLALEMNGVRYLVGEFAMREDIHATRVMAPDRITGPEYRALLGAVVMAAQKGDGESTLFTGLPYNTSREDLSRLESDLLTLTTPMSGVSGAIKGVFWGGQLRSVRVFKQAQAIIFDAIFERVDGKITPVRDQELLEVEHTRAAVVDIGYKTTDVIVCEIQPEFRIIQELSFTINHAISSVGRRLQEAFRRATKDNENTLDTLRLESALRGKAVPHMGKIIDLSVDLHQAARDVARQIMNQIFEKWGKALMTIHVVYLGGGGAELLAPTLVKNMHENVHKIDTPHGANARGYYKMQFFLNMGNEERKAVGPSLRRHD